MVPPPFPLPKVVEVPPKKSSKNKKINTRKRQFSITELASKRPRSEGLEQERNKEVVVRSELFTLHWQLMRSSSINNLETAFA